MPLVTSGVDHGNLRELAIERLEELGLPCRDVRTREVGIKQIHHRINPDQVELIRRDYTANGGWETFLSYEDPVADILIGLLRLRKCSTNSFRPEVVNTSTSKGGFNSGTRGSGESKGSDSDAPAFTRDTWAQYGDLCGGAQGAAYESGANANASSSTSTSGDYPVKAGTCHSSIVRELHVYGSAVPLSGRDPTKFQHQVCVCVCVCVSLCLCLFVSLCLCLTNTHTNSPPLFLIFSSPPPPV